MSITCGKTGQTFIYDDDVAINYETEGNGQTPVVFLHGFAAGLITWHDIRPLFDESLFRLYLPDLKGFGYSSKPDDHKYAPEDQADVVLSFIKGLNLRHAVLVGHSLGGGIALLVFQRAEAGMIERMVLIDPSAYPQRLPRIIRWLRVPILGMAILQFLPIRFMVYCSLIRVFHDKKAITSDRIDRYATCFDRKGIVRSFIGTCRQITPGRYAGLSRLYRSIAIPTLIIWGEEDHFISLSLGKKLKSEIPGSRLVVISGCGHNPHEERPAETFAAISQFLEASDRLLPENG